MREIDKTVVRLADCLCPEKFSNSLLAVKKLCKLDSSNHFGIPSLALKIGHSLKKCALIQVSQSIFTKDDINRKDAKDFLTLCKIEWSDEVATAARTTLQDAKVNKPKILSLSQDLQKLQKYLKSESSKYCLHL